MYRIDIDYGDEVEEHATYPTFEAASVAAIELAESLGRSAPDLVERVLIMAEANEILSITVFPGGLAPTR